MTAAQEAVFEAWWDAQRPSGYDLPVTKDTAKQVWEAAARTRERRLIPGFEPETLAKAEKDLQEGRGIPLREVLVRRREAIEVVK